MHLIKPFLDNRLCKAASQAWFFLLSLIGSTGLFAQVEWATCMGGIGNEHFNEIIQLKDGNLVGVGDKSWSNTSDYNGDIGQDVWVVKFSPQGDTLWSRTFGGDNQDRGHGISQLNDCSILVCAYTHSSNGDVRSNAGDSDGWALKLDQDGNIIWSATFGGTSSDWFFGIYQDQNDDIYLLGTAYSTDGDISNHNGNADFWLVKTDNDGNLISSQCFGGSGLDRGCHITETGAGNFIMSGLTSSNDGPATSNHGGDDFLLIHVDENGSVLWSNCYGGSGDDLLEKNGVHKINGNHYVIAGTSSSSDGDLNSNFGMYDFALIQIDAGGNVLQASNYGGSQDDYACSVVITPDQNIMIFGQSRSDDFNVTDHFSEWDYWLIKVNQSGNILLSKSLGTLYGDHGRTIVNTFDYGYVLGGFSYGNYCTGGASSGWKDWQIYKLNSSFDPFNDSLMQAATVRLCPGDSLLFNGNYVTTDGIHYGVTSSTSGCDSAIFVNVSLSNFASEISNGEDSTILCAGDSLELASNSAATTYQWSDGSSGNAIIATQPGIYWLTSSDGECSVTDTILVLGQAYPTVDLGADTLLCDKQAFTLTADPAQHYLWSNGANTQSISIQNDGLYWVQAANGSCIASDTVVFTYSAVADLDLGNDTLLCMGDAMTLHAVEADGYQWSDQSQNATLSVASPGTYWVNVQQQHCMKSDTILVGYTTYPAIDLGNDTTICGQAPLTLSGGLADHYIWSNGEETPSITIAAPGIYALTASNGACSSADTIAVTAYCNVQVVFPNVFSPDEDGINDVFTPIHHDGLLVTELLILNRWGQTVYRTSDLSEGWNGNSGDQPCSEGVYFWKLEYETVEGSSGNLDGFVTLIR